MYIPICLFEFDMYFSFCFVARICASNKSLRLNPMRDAIQFLFCCFPIFFFYLFCVCVCERCFCLLFFCFCVYSLFLCYSYIDDDEMITMMIMTTISGRFFTLSLIKKATNWFFFFIFNLCLLVYFVYLFNLVASKTRFSFILSIQLKLHIKIS